MGKMGGGSGRIGLVLIPLIFPFFYRNILMIILQFLPGV